MPKTRGITFDLTKGKDLICALPYREYGMDVDWIFVMCFRDEKKRLHWFTTEESLRLCKSTSPRPLFTTPRVTPVTWRQTSFLTLPPGADPGQALSRISRTVLKRCR